MHKIRGERNRNLFMLLDKKDMLRKNVVNLYKIQ